MVNAVIFDLGGVLIDWNPRYLYRKVFGADTTAMEHFLANICTSDWNEQQDAGRPFADAVRLLSQQHPEHAAHIALYDTRWPEMLAGAIEPTVQLLSALRGRGVPLYALTNWSHEKFPVAKQRFEFLGWFEHILVSGEVRLKKPDRRIFELLLERIGRRAEETLFIDDSPKNVAAARQLGMQAVQFETPAGLEKDLRGLGLL